MTDSPWLTVRETAAYSRRHKDTVLRALRECQRNGGRSGLKGLQQRANTTYRIHRDDVDRWMRGDAPARGLRRSA